MSAGAMQWLDERPVSLDFNGPVDIPFEPFPDAETRLSLVVRFERMAARYPDRIAVDDGTTRLTYAELLRKARHLSERIHAETPPGRPIVAVLRYTPLCPVFLLAGIAAGRPLIPIDALHPQERQQAILRNAHASTIIVQAGVAIETELPDLPLMTVDLDALDDGAWPPVPFDPDALAGVVYTSGSTGRPKGIAWNIAALLQMIAQTTNANHTNATDKIISLGSISSAGFSEVLLALMNGATLRLIEITQAGVGELLHVLGEERVTIVTFVPSILRSILQVDGADHAFRHLRVLDLIGDVTLAQDVAFFRTRLPADCHIRVILGSMEAGSIFHWFVPRDWQGPELALPAGYLAQGKQVAVLDETGSPAPPGEEGELVVRGTGIALGSWQDGRLAAGPIRPDPDDPTIRVYPMGDLVRLRPDGLALFVGRRDRQVKVRGMKADMGEIEAALHLHPAIDEVAVVAVRESADNAIVAYCTFRDPDALPSAREVRETVQHELSAHMVPSRIYILDAIPRLPNWKPDLLRLAERAGRELDHQADAELADADDLDPEILDAVEAAWASVLGDRAARGATWAASGGDSLQELKLIHAIEDALDCTIPHLLEQDHTAADVARAVQDYLLDTPAEPLPLSQPIGG